MSARATALLAIAALAIGGCGSGGATATPAAMRLQREDFVDAARGLVKAEPAVARAAAAARLAWPLVAGGLPADTRTIPQAPIRRAGVTAAAVGLPPPFAEAEAASLTGSAAKIAGMFHNFSGLTSRGWRLIGSSIEELQHGSAATARFARENVALYIQGIYDGHRGLSQVGRQVADAYTKLGGPAAFGAALTQQEVDALASAYSKASVELEPHPDVALGG